MEEKIKLTNVQTIGKVVKKLREIFGELDWKEMRIEKTTRRLPRREEYVTSAGVRIILKCPENRNVVRGIYVKVPNQPGLNYYLESAEAI